MPFTAQFIYIEIEKKNIIKVDQSQFLWHALQDLLILFNFHLKMVD